jgi:hypothetical protein
MLTSNKLQFLLNNNYSTRCLLFYTDRRLSTKLVPTFEDSGCLSAQRILTAVFSSF